MIGLSRMARQHRPNLHLVIGEIGEMRCEFDLVDGRVVYLTIDHSRGVPPRFDLLAAGGEVEWSPTVSPDQVFAGVLPISRITRIEIDAGIAHDGAVAGSAIVILPGYIFYESG
jgi:hypothetical protein